MAKLQYDYIKEYIEDIGFILVSKEYLGINKKMILKDKDDFYYTSTYANFRKGSVPFKYIKSNPYTIQNIKLWCKLNDKSFKLLSDEYEGTHEKLKWKCLKEDCGEIFKSSWHSISIGYGCLFCVGKEVGLSNCLATKNPKLASEWHPTLNGDLTPYNVTCGNGNEIWWRCEKRHEWKASIASRNQGKNCPYCAGNLPSEENNLLVCDPKLCEEWDYENNKNKPEEYCPNSNKKAWWKCNKCNHKWEATINSRNNGNGCPRCNQSKGEKKIDEILLERNIIHIGQYKFDDCKYKITLPFDTFLPNYNTCIEYQGRQHYEPVDFAGKGEEWALEQFELTKIKDQIKRDYCKKNNIKLIEIPYWDYDRIEEILNDYIKIKYINLKEENK